MTLTPKAERQDAVIAARPGTMHAAVAASSQGPRPEPLLCFPLQAATLD